MCILSCCTVSDAALLRSQRPFQDDIFLADKRAAYQAKLDQAQQPTNSTTASRARISPDDEVESWSQLVSMGRPMPSKSRYEKPYNICTSESAPMVLCRSAEEQGDYNGYQVRFKAETMALALIHTPCCNEQTCRTIYTNIACNDIAPQIQLFSILAKELGWSETDWQWGGCLDWDEMMQDLADPEGRCFMAAAGVFRPHICRRVLRH